VEVFAGQTATFRGSFNQNAGDALIDGTFRFADGGGTYLLAAGTLTGAGEIQGNLLQNCGTFLVRLTDGGGDALGVTGSIVLDASASLALALTGYTPQSGQSWDILTATGGITGGFASVPSGYTFSVVNGGTTGRLTFGTAAVPEPGTLGLALTALAPLAFAVARRRPRRERF
jgi:hypothetical protein